MEEYQIHLDSEHKIVMRRAAGGWRAEYFARTTLAGEYTPWALVRTQRVGTKTNAIRQYNRARARGLFCRSYAA